MTVTEFLDNEVVDFASYSTLRAIASVVDGLKNAHRKVVYYTQNSPVKERKVLNYAGEVMTSTEYLHGDISGSIIALAQNHTGTNNIPLLTREGNFGSRFEPEASAIRYIYSSKEKHFDKIFNKVDNNVLIQQEFEGTKIEPRFFVPSIPLLLVNGSEGIATGFAQKILPRSVDVLKDYIKSSLNGGNLPELPPHYNGFNGVIEKTETPNQYLIKGTFEKVSNTKLIITEIPVGYSLKQYTKVLDTLEDKKVVKSYKDLSENDEFKFEVSVEMKFMKGVSSDDILEKLKLVKKVTENFTVIDENNRVIAYNSPEEVIQHYIKIKLKYMHLRKDYLTQKTKEDLLVLASRYLFIKNIVDANIIINKVKKENIIAQLETYDKIITVDGSYDYLLNMPIYNLTEEKLEELLEAIKNKKVELQEIQNKSIESTWEEEIDTI